MTATATARDAVRVAQASDLPALIDMGVEFAAHYPLATDEIDPYELDATLRGFMDSPDAVVLVLGPFGLRPYGVLIGLESRLWFAPGTRVAIELAWWVDPWKRGGSGGIRLVQAFERWAQARGIEHVCMSDIATVGSSAGPLIERQGYKLKERSYVKRIQQTEE